jgi:hypothetical protein
VAADGSELHAVVHLREKAAPGLAYVKEGTGEQGANVLLDGRPQLVRVKKVEAAPAAGQPAGERT